MKHLIIGYGSIGKRHLKNLFELGEKSLVIVDPNPVRQKEATHQFGATSFPELKSEIVQTADAIYVTSPNIFHIPHALMAARAGCHLFVEKPLSISLDGVDELIQTIKDHHKIGFVGSNWKFHPAFKKMKSLLEEKTIGQILTVRCVSGKYLPDWHPWEDYRQMYSAKKKLGGGIIFDSHELDYLTWLLGDIKELVCFSDHLSDLDIETEDAALLLLRFKNGILGQVQLDYLQRASQRRYEFCGSEGSMIWDTNEHAVKVYRAADKKWETFNTPKDYDLNMMYLDEIKHFLACVRGEVTPVTSLEQGHKVLKILLAAHQSSSFKKIFTPSEITNAI